MANFGHYEYERGRGSFGQADQVYSGSASATSFEYGHGQTRSKSRDRRRSLSPLLGSRNDKRNGRQSRYDQPKRASLLETPPPSYAHEDFGSSFDTDRRPLSPPRPHHTRSRSPLLGYRHDREVPKDFDLPPRDQPHLGFEAKRARSPAPVNLERERDPYFDPNRDLNYGRDDFSPNMQRPDRRHSRDRDGYGILDEPHRQPPLLSLLPEPDLAPVSSKSRPRSRRSFSPDMSRDRNGRRDPRDRVEKKRYKEFPDKPLLPDPEPDRPVPLLESEHYHRPSRRSFSPDYKMGGDRAFQDQPRRSDTLSSKGRQDYKTPDDVFSPPRPPLLPEPATELWSLHSKKSVKDILGGFVLPAPQDVQTQFQMEQTLFHSQELLQKLEQKDREKDERLAKLKEDSRTQELKRLGITPKSLVPKKPWGDELDPARKRQIDEELRRLGVGSKRRRSNDPQQQGLLPTPADERRGLLPEPSGGESLLPPPLLDSYPEDYRQNQDRYPDPAFQNDSRRQTLLPDPGPSPNRGLSDGLLPTPEGAGLGRRLDNEARRNKWKGDSRSKRQSSSGNKRDSWQDKPRSRSAGKSDRHSRGRSSDSAFEKRNDRKAEKTLPKPSQRNDRQAEKTLPKPSQRNDQQAEKTLPKPSQQSSQSKAVEELPDKDYPETKSGGPYNEGKFQEVKLIVDTVRDRPTTLVPSSLAEGVKPKKKAVAKSTLHFDDKITGSQFNTLLSFGEHTRILLYDRILENFYCYICDVQYNDKKAFVDHELGPAHKNKMYLVQDNHGVNRPINHDRLTFMKQLADLPSIYQKSGRNLCIKPELVSRDDFYFVCRVCHDVFRGPVEEHFKTEPHKTFEWQQIPCDDCKMLFANFQKRKKHYQRTMHQKVMRSTREKFQKRQPVQKQKSPKSTAAAAATATASAAPTATPPPPSTPKASTTASSKTSDTKTQNTVTAPKSTPTSSSESKRTSSTDKGKPAKVATTLSTSKATSDTARPAVAKKEVPVKAAGKDSTAKGNKVGSSDTNKNSSANTSNIVSTGPSKEPSKGTSSNVTVEAKPAEKKARLTQRVGNVLAKESQESKQESKSELKKEAADRVTDFISKIPSLLQDNPGWKGEIRGKGFTAPVVGFFCKVCGKFYNEKKSTRDQHCSSLEHHLHIKLFKLKQDNSRPLPKWMEGLPGSDPPRIKHKKAPAETPDIIEVVDMEVDDKSPDADDDEESTETSEWFDGDLM